MSTDFALLTVVNVLRARRLSLGISLQQLSAMIDVPSSQLVAVEAGGIEIDLLLFSALSQALGSEAGKLMYQAETLEHRMTPREQRLMLQTLRTQRQLYKIEQQLIALAKQRVRVVCQVESMKEKSANVVVSEERLAVLLANQRLISEKARQRLNRVRKACEESERFTLRTIRSFLLQSPS
ncbi:MAG TPA: helix-turn-helix transcriptional regulator [Oculatellaceae cyanobacterium]